MECETAEIFLESKYFYLHNSIPITCTLKLSEKSIICYKEQADTKPIPRITFKSDKKCISYCFPLLFWIAEHMKWKERGRASKSRVTGSRCWSLSQETRTWNDGWKMIWTTYDKIYSKEYMGRGKLRSPAMVTAWWEPQLVLRYFRSLYSQVHITVVAQNNNSFVTGHIVGTRTETFWTFPNFSALCTAKRWVGFSGN